MDTITAPTTVATSTKPMHDTQRFALRLALEAAGCEVAGYVGGGFTVQIKRNKFAAVCERADQLQLTLRTNSLNYFPLGTDNPPAEFRHWCPPYTDERGFRPGFWLYATFDAQQPIC